MTPTTPTPALADLDLDKLEALADAATLGEWTPERGMVSAVHPRSNDADGTTILATFTGYFDKQHANAEFCAAFNPEMAKKLIALARRAAQPNSPEFGGIAAQPVAPVQANCPYCGKHDGTHDDVFPHPRPTPSPQIAEVAELPPLPEPDGSASVPVDESRFTFTEVDAWSEELVRQAQRDAIAASRRAAGGELIDLLRAIRPNYGAVGSRDVDVTAQRARIDRAIELLSAAPASAGQAAPAAAVRAAERIDAMHKGVVSVFAAIKAEHLAAQPAEGAGQAGQVAFEPTDQQYADWCKRHDLPEHQSRDAFDDAASLYLDAAPTERAAAPAEQPDDWQAAIAEVERATLKFPTWPTDPLHAVAVLGEEFGELTKAVLQTTYEPHKVQPGELRTEAIQTAAMSLRFLASLGRYEFARSPQHEQGSTHQPSAQKGGEA